MRKSIIFLGLLTIFSCEGEKEKIPDYVWSQERFTEVLTEFQLAEAIVRLGYHRSNDSLIPNDSIYNAVFRKMNINKVEFDSNYNYYLKDPKILEEVYDEVLINLTKRSTALKSKSAAKDSTKSE